MIKHIAVDIRCLMERELTGVGEYTKEILGNMFQKDNKNQYYLFYNSRKDVSGVLPRFDYPNVHFCGFRWPNKLLSFCLLVFKWPKLDKLIAKKYKTPRIDLFFFPNIGFISASCKYIITAHDLSFAYFSEFLSFGRKLWHFLVNPARLYRESSGIIAVSENTKNDLHRYYGISKERITVVTSGVSADYRVLEKSAPELDHIRKMYKLPAKFFLFLGTLEPRKNVLSLIAAFNLFQKKNYQKYTLVIAGKRGWKCDDILEKIAEYNLLNKEKIIYLDFVDSAHKPGLYNLATGFVFPSFYEGFGFPVLEAMACGCPVIAANNSSLSEICGNSAILVDAVNVNDLADAFDLACDSSLVKTFSAKGVEKAKKYCWHAAADKTLRLLESVCR